MDKAGDYSATRKAGETNMATARKERDFPSADFERFKKLNERLRALEEERLEDRRKEAWEKARAVATMLKERFSAEQVVLYGSLARGDFQEGSDIDLLVEGMRGSYWDMYVAAEECAAPFEVNVVCREDARPALIEAAMKEGVIL